MAGVGADDTPAAARVVMMPLPFQGNLTPMLQLAGALHARGLAATVLRTAPFNAPDPARHPGIAFVPVAVDVPEAVVGSEDNMTKVFDLNAALDASGCLGDALASLLEKEAPRRPACLVTDAAFPAAQKAAMDLGLPWLVLHTCSAATFRLFMSYHILYGNGYLPKRESNLCLPVKELPPLQVRDLFDPSELPNQENVQKIMNLWNQTKMNSATIINTFEDLEGPELEMIWGEVTDNGTLVFNIGPLHKLSPIGGTKTSLLEEDCSCIEWLDTQAPCSVLYVSFGSLAQLTQEEFTEIAWGLANSEKPFLWVVRRGLVLGVEKPELPEGFERALLEGRGKVVEWAPQQNVLAHSAVGGFWTHNGWNSTLESIYEGVPMVSRPIFGDQFSTGRYVEAVWKIGFLLDGVLERRKIERVIQRLMVEKEGLEARQRAKDLKKKAIMCLESNGSSQMVLDNLVHHILSL
ncbi:hypothetical protein HU200_007537 [Digitaria exilis]|uniref:UDP-glycosyltransferase n=1 Tax=Digitaria exilis TaxID=1010633 RepID=A0A835FN03_9POAL|nr:hypothetical protein HU200_007537 [Digitaria exilis]